MKNKHPELTLIIAIIIGVLLGKVIKNFKVAFGLTLLVALLITVNIGGRKKEE